MQELKYLKTSDIAEQVAVSLTVFVDEAHRGNGFSLLIHVLRLTFNPFSLIYRSAK